MSMTNPAEPAAPPSAPAPERLALAREVAPKSPPPSLPTLSDPSRRGAGAPDDGASSAPRRSSSPSTAPPAPGPASASVPAARDISPSPSLSFRPSSGPRPSRSQPHPDDRRRRAAAADLVLRSLFGPDGLGDVLRDYPCSFQRGAGRLYVTTTGLFFYSNLFGFERRIQISYGEAKEVSTLRTTSIRIASKDGEEYIFRSFEDRIQVLDLVAKYYTNVIRGEGSSADNGRGGHASNGGRGRFASAASAMSATSAGEETRDNPSNEAASAEAKRQEDTPSPEPAENTRPITSNNAGARSRVSSADSAKAIDGPDWEAMKLKTKDWKSAIAGVAIPCSSEQEFFHSFLRDDAPRSLRAFGTSIGDEIRSFTAWEVDLPPEERSASGDATAASSPKSISRTIELDRRAGPRSVVRVTRRQTYRRLGARGVMTNVTHVNGIRGLPDDVFHVEDVWFIDVSTKEGGVSLGVKFRVVFSQKTMLKSIINGRTASETKEYYRKYAAFVARGTGRGAMAGEVAPADEVDARVGGDAEKGAGAEWMEALLSLAKQFAADRWEELAPLVRSCASDPSTLLRSGPALLLVVYFVASFVRLRRRVEALEDITRELEKRLLDVEALRYVEPPDLGAEL